MNAQKNAKRIFDACKTEIDTAPSISFDPVNKYQLIEIAKICALIAIDKIIEQGIEFKNNGDWKVAYLQEVKQELKKL